MFCKICLINCDTCERASFFQKFAFNNNARLVAFLFRVICRNLTVERRSQQFKDDQFKKIIRFRMLVETGSGKCS